MTSSGMGNFNDYDRQALSHESFHDFDVFGDSSEKIGKVVAVEKVGTEGLPHVIVKVGSWLSSQQVLLPLQHYQADLNHRRLYLEGLTQDSLERMQSQTGFVQVPDMRVESSVPVESSTSLEEPMMRTVGIPVAVPSSADVPAATSNSVSEEETIRLLAERVVVDRHKRKAGEIVVRKVIETEKVEVLVRREKLIVEQVSPEYRELAVIDLGQTSTPQVNDPDTQSGRI
jgi:stress response protein YsnF